MKNFFNMKATLAHTELAVMQELGEQELKSVNGGCLGDPWEGRFSWRCRHGDWDDRCASWFGHRDFDADDRRHWFHRDRDRDRDRR